MHDLFFYYDNATKMPVENQMACFYFARDINISTNRFSSICKSLLYE